MRKRNSLRANADVERVRSEGSARVHPLLVISFLPNGLEHSRFGFAVGRRMGNAVQRNRTKRRLREAVRLRLQGGEIVPGWDVVLIARHPVRAAPFHQIDGAIDLLLRQAGLVSEKT